MSERTIAAIATPTGRGGIGIIRISGGRARDIALSLFVLPTGQSPVDFQSHRMYYGHIVDAHETVIDEVMLVYMRGPKSYTAEDVVEIQSHASPIVLRHILDEVIKKGADLSEPGEFTKRAFLNGRIDLTQAEAVIDIINARTGTSLSMALSQIKGELKDRISELTEILYDLRARLEAGLDFPDDVNDTLNDTAFKTTIQTQVIDKLTVLKKNFDDTNIFRDGIKIALAGAPNAGKSSLLNALLNKEKAIVTPVPGTTRDLIDDLINIEGIPFEVTDTAGLQDTDDHVEKIGIQKTLDRIRESDVIILMYDGSRAMGDDEKGTLNNLIERYTGQKKILVVENKIDLYSEKREGHSDITPDIRISVKNKQGIDTLKKKLADEILRQLPENRSSVVPNVRHMRLIDKARLSCEQMMDSLSNNLGWELIALDLQECIDCLEEILGNTTREDVLDRIFNDFCIGK